MQDAAMSDLIMGAAGAQELAVRVKAGIAAGRQDSSKWGDLYKWLAKHFEIPPEQIRASLLANLGNITNRVFKDNAWENPQVLALVCVEAVTPEIADGYVDQFVSTFHSRLDVLPRLRVALIFDGDTLVKVKKLSSVAVESGIELDEATAVEDDQP
jgi:hypothetical protein